MRDFQTLMNEKDCLIETFANALPAGLERMYRMRILHIPTGKIASGEGKIQYVLKQRLLQELEVKFLPRFFKSTEGQALQETNLDE